MDDLLIIGKYKLPVKVALTKEEQRNGLMFQSQPHPIMVFPYDKLAVRKFWMKNTPSPLDIVFCKNNKIIEIHEGIPYSEASIGPDCPVDLIVEFPKGMVEKLAIAPGQDIRIKMGIETVAKKFAMVLAR